MSLTLKNKMSVGTYLYDLFTTNSAELDDDEFWPYIDTDDDHYVRFRSGVLEVIENEDGYATGTITITDTDGDLFIGSFTIPIYSSDE